MNFNEQTRELASSSGYIHKKDDTLYVNYPIYLGKYDSIENYEEGNKIDFDIWVEAHKEIIYNS